MDIIHLIYGWLNKTKQKPQGEYKYRRYNNTIEIKLPDTAAA